MNNNKGTTERGQDIADLTEEQAREHLEGVLWPLGPVCPHCKSRKSTKLSLKGWRHYTVNHTKKEYARREPDGTLASTNTVESTFSLLKRGVIGTFHHLSRKHLHRYCAEFDFRWNERKVKDKARVQSALEKTTGRRLTYREVVGEVE